LITSRIEGEATGILIAKHHVTRVQAASLLRQASRQRLRKLHQVAAGVVRSVDLDSSAVTELRTSQLGRRRGQSEAPGAIRGC